MQMITFRMDNKVLLYSIGDCIIIQYNTVYTVYAIYTVYYTV